MKYKIVKVLILTTFVSLNLIACTADGAKGGTNSQKTSQKIEKTEEKASVKKISMEDLHKLQSKKKNDDDMLIVDVILISV